ncbi:hypothetical protein PHYBOEH_002182 [Phytophthora boehmeriae]|uniref:Cytochrome P450 n=1 Tax=Phytophthora boehmeriae TaxID=109152 RepID=A0A8T1WXK4_9STRA|nr:hypothetical protein PHYBOEH_002182 [Phytophthora boehmeriae]
MLAISLLRESVSVDAMSVGGLLFVAAVGLWIQSRSGSTAGRSSKRRPAHRPDTTLPILENTLDLVRNAINGDIHHRSTLHGQQFNAEPVLIRALGMPDNFFLFTPQAFEDVLKLQFENFPKGSYICDNFRDLLGGGIFAADGEQWVHQRKTASNLFTMRALRDSMTAVIQRHTAVLKDILGRASDRGEILDLFNLLNRFTIEAFAEIGFGVHMGCLDAEEEHPFQKAFDRAQRAILFRFIRPSWFWKTQKWLNVGMEGQLQRDIQVINTTVLEIVEKALAQRSGGSGKVNNGQGRDIVSLFLDNIASSADSGDQKFDPMYLRDIVVNFLIAGRDTTAQALSWFFVNLSQNPHVEIAIREEIADRLSNASGECDANTPYTMEDVNQFVYLEAALKETLRLHPSVPIETKHTLHDTTLSDGTFIPAGSRISLSNYGMARMSQVWGPDAKEFKPERWIDTTTGKLITVSAYKFATFNAGPRICLGKSLAMLEMKLVVVELLSKFHLEVLNPNNVMYDLSVTLPVKGALSVKISRTSLLKRA